MKLSDFDPLGPAEQKLVDWLKAGNLGTCVISDKVPKAPTPEVTISATLIRYLALGGCDACKPPETGLRVRGAWIAGDDKLAGETKGLDFEGATLSGDLVLVACRIPDPILLNSARTRNLILKRSIIGSGIKGKGLGVEGEIDLSCTQIHGEVRLIGASISGDLCCDHTSIEQIVESGGKKKALTANRITIGGAFKLRGSEKRIFGRLSLDGAQLRELCDEAESWPDHIVLNLCRYDLLGGSKCPTDAKRRLDWLSRIPTRPGEFHPDAYEHCAKVLREMGHGSDARTILIEKERLQRKARRDRVAMDLAAARRARDAAEPVAGVRPHSDRVVGLWWLLLGLRVWDGILAAFVGYGRKPQNAAVWGLAMLVLGTLVFAHAAGHGAIKPNLPQVQLHPAWVDCAGATGGQLACFLASDSAAAYPRFNALIYSADTLIPVVSLEMQSYWIPDDRSDRGMLVRAYLWFHISMGWALTLLAVAGFSGLIKTDSR